MRKLKRIVIKEELVALTGDFRKAVILNQFLYWSERVKDFDKFIEEERKRAEKEGQEITIEPQNGWIYKTAEELSEETMLGLSPQTIRRLVKDLVKNGWVDERTNPKYKWDRTKQYRPNLVKIQNDLMKLGYSLEGYEILSNPHSDAFSKMENGKTKMENQKKKNGEAIPEITTKNIYKEHNNTLKIHSTVQGTRNATKNSQPEDVVVFLNKLFKNAVGYQNKDFIESLLDQYDPDYVKGKLLLLQKNRASVKNPEGWLTKALEKNYNEARFETQNKSNLDKLIEKFGQPIAKLIAHIGREKAEQIADIQLTSEGLYVWANDSLKKYKNLFKETFRADVVFLQP